MTESRPIRRRALLAGLPAAAAVQTPAPRPSTPRAPTHALTMGQGTQALTLDAGMRIVPQLARSHAMASNLMACTLKLRPRVRFHDGTTLDADAVKLNLERLMSPQRNPTNRSLWDRLASVETPDAETVIIRTTEPYRDLPNALAHPSGVLVSPAAIASIGEFGIAAHPVGAGPYRLASFTPAEQVVLDAFEDYWGGRPRLAHITFRTIDDPGQRLAALRRNEVQVIDGVPAGQAATLEQDVGVTVAAVPGLRMAGFAINMSRPALADPRVRRALNLALPVAQLVDAVFHGYARVPDSPLAFGAEGYAPVGPLAFDPAAAADLLAQAGHGPDRPLPLALFVPNRLSAADTQLGTLVAEALREVHVNVTITRIAGGAYWDELRLARAGLRWDLALFGFQPENASGLHHLTTLFRSNRNDALIPDAWNIGRYRNPEVDRLLTAAGRTASEAEFRAAMAQAQTLIWHDAPYVWLPMTEVISASRAAVTGLEVQPAGYTILRRAGI